MKSDATDSRIKELEAKLAAAEAVAEKAVEALTEVRSQLATAHKELNTLRAYKIASYKFFIRTL